MPRKSLAAITTIPRVDGRQTPLLPPSGLSNDAAAVWRQIIAATDSGHFKASDSPLLRSYCEATALADRAAAELSQNGAVADGRVSAWLAVHEKATRVQNTLALRLRLCPSARTDPKTTGRLRDSGVSIDFGRTP